MSSGAGMEGEGSTAGGLLRGNERGRPRTGAGTLVLGPGDPDGEKGSGCQAAGGRSRTAEGGRQCPGGRRTAGN